MRDYIVATAKDGYEVFLALEEIDPMFQQNQVLAADTMDDKPLDDKHGPLQLVVPADQRPARGVLPREMYFMMGSFFLPSIETRGTAARIVPLLFRIAKRDAS